MPVETLNSRGRYNYASLPKVVHLTLMAPGCRSSSFKLLRSCLELCQLCGSFVSCFAAAQQQVASLFCKLLAARKAMSEALGNYLYDYAISKGF